MAIYLTLFAAGMLTILLPCILPLIPIVLGVSITGRNPWRPLLTVAGMLLSFVGFTFLLQVVLSQFVEAADVIRIATFDVLFLFGLGFLTHHKYVQIVGALLASLFFLSKGPLVVGIAAVLNVIAMEVGGRIASWLQQLGTDIQIKTRQGLGEGSPWTALIIGLTLGLVWVPCAGPALSFALTLVRNQPGLMAFLALFTYGAGTAVPLLIVGYGGQKAVTSVRALTKYSGLIKQISGVFLMLTAIALSFNVFENIQVYLANNTSFGDVGTRLEEKLFGTGAASSDSSPSLSSMGLPKLPKIVRAPEFTGLGTWHNSQPLTMKELRGKVVLVDFWTYSCINCIRTLPYIQGYWGKFKDQNFVLVGVHTPEFVFEKSEKNVAAALKKYGLTYPVAQDNDFGTWSAFANQYWPAKYLIDKDGYIRYTHFGEGSYEETDKAIQALLVEAGATALTPDPSPTGRGESSQDGRRDRSPEIYLGERSWPAFASAAGEPDANVHTYAVPTSLGLNKYALSGNWQLMEGERQILQSETGELHMQWLGSEINLVLGPEDGMGTTTGDVFIDGKKVKTIEVDHDDLYNLYTGDYGEHSLVLKFKGKGVGAYAFTFGV